MIQVFSKDWFEAYQKPLLRFANTKVGRWILCINGDRSSVGKNKIVKIAPNAITWVTKIGVEDIELQTEFIAYNKYADLLYCAFKPLWWLLHGWDWATSKQPEWNLGFDTLTKISGSIGADNPCDGYVTQTGANVTFATLVAGAGSAHNKSEVYNGIFSDTSSNKFKAIRRGIFCFDTSDLTEDATVSAATVSLYFSSNNTGLGDGLVDIVSSAPAATDVLANGDYDSLGSVDFAHLTISTLGAGYNAFSLNASGIANISKTGISQFGSRLEWDRANSFGGTWSNSNYQIAKFESVLSGAAGTEPKLVVTYTTGVTQLCSETISFPDTVIKSTTRVQSESVSLVAMVLKGPARLLAEAVALVDVLVKSASRLLSDALSLVDTFSSILTKLKELTEVIAVVAVVNKGATRVISAVIAIGEFFSKLPGKIFSEAVSLIENLFKMKASIAELLESIAVGEILTKSSARVITVVVSIGDVLSKSFYKIFTEAVSLFDLITAKMPWMKQSRPSTSYTKQDRPVTSFTPSTKPTTVFTKQPKP